MFIIIILLFISVICEMAYIAAAFDYYGCFKRKRIPLYIGGAATIIGLVLLFIFTGFFPWKMI